MYHRWTFFHGMLRCRCFLCLYEQQTEALRPIIHDHLLDTIRSCTINSIDYLHERFVSMTNSHFFDLNSTFTMFKTRMKGIDKTVLEGSEYHMCASKVMLLVYFSFSSFLWTAAMSHSSHLTVKNLFSPLTVQTSRRSSMRRDSLAVGTSAFNQGSSHTSQYSVWYHVGCWGLPIIFCLLFASNFVFVILRQNIF